MEPEIRRLGIGGSDVGALFNVDPYRDAFSLWAEKKGGMQRAQNNDGNIRQIVGKALEPGVLKLYEWKTGREVLPCDVTQQHPVRPWMVYTPDALVVGEKRGVDAKVVFWDQRRKWGLTADDIPHHIQLQCWWYMACMDYDAWDVAALIGEGEPRIYSIDRDEDAEKVLVTRVGEWYARYIAGDEMPPIDGSGDASRWLQQTFPDHARPDIVQASVAEIAWLEEYAAVRGEQKVLSERRDLLENRIKQSVANHEGLVWERGKFTWRKTKDSSSIDWEGMAQQLLTAYVPDTAARLTLIEEHTRQKPGHRRIHFQHDLLAAAEAA